jgi:hypothetical protein
MAFLGYFKSILLTKSIYIYIILFIYIYFGWVHTLKMFSILLNFVAYFQKTSCSHSHFETCKSSLLHEELHLILILIFVLTS